MVLESTGKESLPLSNENYMTYRYAVDKDCNIEDKDKIIPQWR